MRIDNGCLSCFLERRVLIRSHSRPHDAPKAEPLVHSLIDPQFKGKADAPATERCIRLVDRDGLETASCDARETICKIHAPQDALRVEADQQSMSRPNQTKCGASLN